LHGTSNRPTSLAKSRKAAPRLRFREFLSVGSNPAGAAVSLQIVRQPQV
jgi:hypothetical protein